MLHFGVLIIWNLKKLWHGTFTISNFFLQISFKKFNKNITEDHQLPAYWCAYGWIFKMKYQKKVNLSIECDLYLYHSSLSHGGIHHIGNSVCNCGHMFRDHILKCINFFYSWKLLISKCLSNNAITKFLVKLQNHTGWF